MKLYQRIIINVTVILIAFLLFTIWYRSSIVNTTPASITAFSSIKRYKVYLITTDNQYQYWEFINQGAANMAEALGINYIWDAPKKSNVREQIEIINRAVENNANALLIAADDPKEIAGVVEDAKAKGVKIIYVDSPAYEEATTTLATDNYEAGVVTGKSMLSILDQLNINSGSIGIVSVANKANTELREKGFRDTLNADGRFHLLDTAYTNGDPTVAQDAADRMIQENKDLVGLIGTSERTSFGVGNAIHAEGNRIVGVGFDKTDRMMQLYHDGSIKAIINQNPYTMGYLGVAEAIAAVLGKDTGPEYIDTGVEVIRHQ